MNISSFLQDMFAIIWVVLGLAAACIVAGWLLGRLLARLIMHLLGRTRVLATVARWFRLDDTSSLEKWMLRVLRWLFLLLSVWGAVRILVMDPDIQVFLQQVWDFITTTVQLTAVNLLIDLLLVALVTYLLAKSFRWVKTGFGKLAGRIEAERGRRLKGIKFQKVQLLTTRQVTDIVLAVARYSRYVVNLLLILVYLTVVFSFFPQTRGFVNNVLDQLFQVVAKGWNSFVDYLPSLLNLAIIILVTHYGLKLIRFFFREVEKKTITLAGFHPEWAKPTFQLVRVAAIALALVVAFPFLPGSASPAFQGISIFIGALFSLGSTSVVGNIVAGIVLTYTRAFRIGDRVQIANTIGDIIDKGLLVTRIRTIKNVEVAIPNSMVLGSHIINYSLQAQERGLILNTTVTIGYDVPWRLMHETLIQAALATQDILPEPRPFVFQTSLDDSYVNYELNAYTKEPQMMANIYSELHQNIQDKCNQAGIEIMSPHYGALRDGNASTIPAEHLPGDYQAPPFQVKLNKDK